MNYSKFHLIRSEVFSKFLILGYKTDKRGTKISIYGTLQKKNDLLDYRAILLTNALRKWGVLPPDKIDEKQYEKLYHQIADLYIFGNDELINIIYNKY